MLGEKTRTMLLKEALFASADLPHGVVVPINYSMNQPNEDSILVKVTVIDTETASQEPENGINKDTDSVIECCLVNITVDANSGRLISIDEALNQLNDPGYSIDPFFTKISGITTDLVFGKYIDKELTEQFISKTDLVLAHNAAFDKPMISRVIPCFKEMNWACSCSGDIEWKDFDLPTRSLKYLLFEKGYFYNAHRASPDVFALIQLMAEMPQAMYLILKNASSQKFVIRESKAPFEIKDSLKSMGFAAHYYQGKFQYWFMEKLNEDDAISIANKLKSMYGADPLRIIYKTELSEKYM